MLKKMDELHENGRWEEGIISSILEKAKDRGGGLVAEQQKTTVFFLSWTFFYLRTLGVQ